MQKMAFDLEIRDAANLEIINAYLYYEEQQPGLGDRFINILERHFEKISIHPGALSN